VRRVGRDRLRKNSKETQEVSGHDISRADQGIKEEGVLTTQLADKPAALKEHGFIPAAKAHKMSAALATEGCISNLVGRCHQSEGL
jgi:hypothetical protein